MVMDVDKLFKGVGDPDLVLHLILSHHGYARPFFPYFDDSNPADFEFELKGKRLTCKGNPCLHRIDSGVASRYWRLVRKYGWWGLAYLEAMLRIADHRQSEMEWSER